ncbi:MAG: hypothetical protein DMG94_07585 [Acidobacteria bacterium]|nr:MAG: hypothetical protein DMG94_07585 [Acidobacteriota bacterium]
MAMSVAKKSFLVFLISLAVASFFWVRHLRRRTTKIQGAVITRNADPRKQLPIADVEVTANDGYSMVQSKSDASGLFTIVLRKPLLRGQIISLQFQHRDYAPLSLTVNAPGNITVAALTPVVRTTPIVDNSARQTIGNTVVRYSIKTASTVPIGSAVRAFEAVNEGGVPCAAHLQCSPDGKWKAATGSTSLDAGEGNEFRNARASCISGPCPFTRIDPSGLAHDGRIISVTGTTWSDTATFLVEAEVVHPMTTDVVRNSYPAIFGDALNFTLPPSAEGVSIQADLNGETIVFPLGPALILSWADCNLRVNRDQTRVFRCELKPGYRWVNPVS